MSFGAAGTVCCIFRFAILSLFFLFPVGLTDLSAQGFEDVPFEDVIDVGEMDLEDDEDSDDEDLSDTDKERVKLYLEFVRWVVDQSRGGKTFSLYRGESIEVSREEILNHKLKPETLESLPENLDRGYLESTILAHARRGILTAAYYDNEFPEVIEVSDFILVQEDFRIGWNRRLAQIAHPELKNLAYVRKDGLLQPASYHFMEGLDFEDLPRRQRAGLKKVIDLEEKNSVLVEIPEFYSLKENIVELPVEDRFYIAQTNIGDDVDEFDLEPEENDGNENEGASAEQFTKLPVASLLTSFSLADSYQLFSSERDLPIFFERLVKADKKGVRYNGVTHFHDLPEGSEIKLIVEALAQVLSEADDDTVRRALASLSPEVREALMKDSNGVDSTDRTEPFDLLTSIFKQSFVEDFDNFVDADSEEEIEGAQDEGDDAEANSSSRPVDRINPIQISKLAKTRVKTLLGIPLENDDLPLLVHRDQANGRIHLICAVGESQVISNYDALIDDSDDDYYSSVGFTHDAVKIPRVNSERKSLLFWQCGDRIYSINFEELDSKGSLPFPPKFDFAMAEESDELHALSTFSIIDHFSKENLNRFLGYMAIRGFVPAEVKSIENAKQAFEEDFKNADLYFPTAHSIQMNHLEIGGESATRVVLQKPSGPGKKAIQFVIYFPDVEGSSSGETMHLNQRQLAELLCARREVRNDPLAVITMSCDSEASVKGWMNAYKLSLFDENGELRLAPEQLRDVPVVFGANRGFSTDSPLDLMSHMEFGLKSADLIAEGASAEQVFENLERPADLGQLKIIVRSFKKSADQENETARVQPDEGGYSPVCNIKPEYDFLSELSNFSQIRVEDAEEPEKAYIF